MTDQTDVQLYITAKAREDLQRHEEIEREKQRLLREQKEARDEARRLYAEKKREEKERRKLRKAQLLAQAKAADEALRAKMEALGDADADINRVVAEGERLEASHKERCRVAWANVEKLRKEIHRLEMVLNIALDKADEIDADYPPTRLELKSLTEVRDGHLKELRGAVLSAESAWKALAQEDAYSLAAAKRARMKHRDRTVTKAAKQKIEENRFR